jgi:integrase
MAVGFLGRPFRQQVEQERVVRLVVGGKSGVRPITPPHHPFGRSIDEGLRHLGGIGIAGRAHFGVDICAGELDPRLALVDQPAKNAEGGMIHAGGLRQMSHVIEDHKTATLQVFDVVGLYNGDIQCLSMFSLRIVMRVLHGVLLTDLSPALARSEESPMRKVVWSDKIIAKLPPSTKPFSDPEMPGFYIRYRNEGGPRTFYAVARNSWTRVGNTSEMGLEEARNRAREIIKRVKAGRPAIEPPAATPESFSAKADTWVRMKVEKEKLIRGPNMVRLMNKHVLPVWGQRDFESIRRSEVAALLDKVENDHGKRQADAVLEVIRSMMHFHSLRMDTYNSPVIRGMNRYNKTANARERTLEDSEIRAVWAAAESEGAYGAFVRLSLVLGQRKEKTRTMRWSDIKDGVWTVPVAAREKGVGGELILPKVALDIIEAQPRTRGNPYVFAGFDALPINNFGKWKKTFSAKVGIPHWTLHDLRRTARTLMTGAGVADPVAEALIGHSKRGMEKIYNRHQYKIEKGKALEALAAWINNILNPPSGNVVAFPHSSR